MTLRDQIVREIEQTPDELLEEILDFCLSLKQRKVKEQSTQAEPPSPIVADAFAQLRRLCAEENYSLEIPPRQDRPNPFDESIV
jgi:hypothetical protein